MWATTLLTHHHFPLPGSSQLAQDPQGLTFGDSRSTGTTVFFKPYALPGMQLSVWMWKQYRTRSLWLTESKKGNTILFSCNFAKCWWHFKTFGNYSSKFATVIIKNSPHLNSVATLPCKIYKLSDSEWSIGQWPSFFHYTIQTNCTDANTSCTGCINYSDRQFTPHEIRSRSYSVKQTPQKCPVTGRSVYLRCWWRVVHTVVTADSISPHQL